MSYDKQRAARLAARWKLGQAVQHRNGRRATVCYVSAPFERDLAAIRWQDNGEYAVTECADLVAI